MPAARRGRGTLRSRLPRLDLVVLARLGGVSGWLALVGGGALLWTYGLPRLAAHAQQLPERSPMRVEIRDQPSWLRGDDATRLALTVLECVAPDPLDREGLVLAREALLGSGWFERVAQVRRVARDRIEVVGTFLEPGALVRRDGRDWLVDREGRLMPRSYPMGEGPELAIIAGATGAVPRRMGDAWSGRDLAGALAVLEVVDRQPWARQIVAVDLSAFASDGCLRLVTDRGTTIRWGRPPGSEGSAEVSAFVKLDYLGYHHRRYGHVDGGLAGELDVSRDVALVR